MSDNTRFGDLLRDYRKELGLSQENFCADIISIRQLHRLEKGEVEPTPYVLDRLSGRYDIDFYSLYRYSLLSNHEGEDYIIRRINDAINAQNYDAMRELAEELEPTVNKMGADLRMHYYYLAAIIHHEEDNVFDYIFKGLSIECSDFNNTVDSFCKCNLSSNVAFCLGLFYGINTALKGETDDALRIFNYMLERVDFLVSRSHRFFQSDSFIYKLYPAILFNYSVPLFADEKYDEILTYTERVLSFLSESGTVSYLSEILWLKTRALYGLGRYKDARHSYLLFKNICELYHKDTYLEKIKNEVHKNYPRLN